VPLGGLLPVRLARGFLTQLGSDDGGKVLSRPLTTGHALVVLVAAVAIGGGAFAIAAIPSPDGTITACVKKSGRGKGAMRVIDASKRCSRKERKLSWNQAGQPGPAGASGRDGATGATGAPGQRGSDAQFNGADAGGDLDGTYPDPTIAPNAIGGAEVTDGSLNGSDVDEAALDESLLGVVLGTGTRVATQRSLVAENTTDQPVIALSGIGSVVLDCGASGQSATLTYTNTSGSPQTAVATSSSEGTTALDTAGGTLANNATLDIVFATNAASDIVRSLKVVAGRDADTAAEFNVALATRGGGSNGCRIFADATG
jgi:hypothetical protein